MIFVVDDEPVYLELIREALEQEGFSVRTFPDPAPALEELSLERPELIFSDIRMPGMDGFEFKEAVDRMIPDGEIPFIFLSSLSQPAHVVRGLDLGAVDYLTKPIDPTILRAKLRSLLRQRISPPEEGRSFRGDLGRFPFVKVLQFCESEGLTGRVRFISHEIDVVLPFRSGEIRLDEMDDADDRLAELYDLEEGEFHIETGAPDFARIADVKIRDEPESEPSARPPEERPMGKLSGLKLLNRLFQIQTEMNFLPEEKISTIVVLDGNAVYKRVSPVVKGWTVPEIQKQIEVQHLEVEAEIRKRAEALVEKKSGESGGDSKEHRFYQIFEAGWEAYRAQNYEEALKLWEEAEPLKPEDPTLKVNLKIVRTKLSKV